VPFQVVGHCRNHLATLYSSSPWSNMPHFRYPSTSRLFVGTLFEFGVVENFVYRARITVILTSDLFGCMSL